MDTIYYPNDSLIDGSYAATIGFFDGVHRGHRHVIGQLREEAGRRGLRTMVVTFERHPRLVVNPSWKPSLLSTLEEKVALIGQTGIDVLVVLRFDEQMARLSARQFMAQVLKERLHVDLLLTGYDNRFGHNREETFDDYAAYGHEIGMSVVAGTPFDEGGSHISSSRIRQLLAEGKVGEAATCLGYHYTIGGQVVHGEQMGRTMGFPTANLRPGEATKLIPRNGAYAVLASIDGGPLWRGMTNIGVRPTFDGEKQTMETYILDASGNFYGKPISIQFVSWLRDEQAFSSPEALARQLECDRQNTENILSHCL